MTRKRFLVIASFADSLLGFRAPLIEALQVKGLEVHVAAPGLMRGSPLFLQLQARGWLAHDYPLQRTGINPLADLRSLWALLCLMLRVRPHYVLGYTIKPVIYGTLAAWLARVPRRFALITGLGYAFAEQRTRSRLGQLVQYLYKLALTRAHYVFFQNPDDAALFRERALLAPDAAVGVVNGSGVDTTQFAVAPLRSDVPCFLLIARLLGDKGVREYAQAARQVRAQHPEARCLLVGWIDDNPDAIAQHELDSWMAEGSLEFLGRLDDVRPAIAECNVYVLPSYREGTPRTVLEAMAMGRAVITTDAPGCRETVVDGNNGFLIPVRDADALATTMLEFIRQPSLIQRMGECSRQMAQERYDVHKVNAVMLREMEIA